MCIRDKVELEDFVADGDGVAGVVAAAVTGHDGRALGQPVGDVALALVAPLCADDDRQGHGVFSGKEPQITQISQIQEGLSAD